MAYRTFTDSSGTEWQVWDVRPQGRGTDRRSDDDRRVITVPIEHAERRGTPDRRAPLVAPGMESGWLCFQAGSDKRRLVPIPTAWESEPNERLEAFLRLAARVTARAAR